VFTTCRWTLLQTSCQCRGKRQHHGWEDVVPSEREVTECVSTVSRCTGQLWTATCLQRNHWPTTRFVSTSNICKRTYSCYYINTRINNVVYCTVFIVLCWSICVSARHAGEVFRNCRWTLGLLETSCQCSAHRISAICCSLEWVSSFLTAHQHIIGHFSAITWY